MWLNLSRFLDTRVYWSKDLMIYLTCTSGVHDMSARHECESYGLYTGRQNENRYQADHSSWRTYCRHVSNRVHCGSKIRISRKHESDAGPFPLAGESSDTNGRIWCQTCWNRFVSSLLRFTTSLLSATCPVRVYTKSCPGGSTTRALLAQCTPTLLAHCTPTLLAHCTAGSSTRGAVGLKVTHAYQRLPTALRG